MFQELQYLRDELNQQIRFQHEQVNKVINLILITWGGVICILVNDKIELMAQEPKTAILYFVGATIFFVSNIILCSCERYGYASADAMFKIGAYIQVFYEKRPSNIVKVGDNMCWETTNFELLTNNVKNKVKFGKNFYEQWLVLNYISLFFLILCSVAAFWANLFCHCAFFILAILYICFIV